MKQPQNRPEQSVIVYSAHETAYSDGKEGHSVLAPQGHIFSL